MNNLHATQDSPRVTVEGMLDSNYKIDTCRCCYGHCQTNIAINLSNSHWSITCGCGRSSGDYYSLDDAISNWNRINRI